MRFLAGNGYLITSLVASDVEPVEGLLQSVTYDQAGNPTGLWLNTGDPKRPELVTLGPGLRVTDLGRPDATGRPRYSIEDIGAATEASAEQVIDAARRRREGGS